MRSSVATGRPPARWRSVVWSPTIARIVVVLALVLLAEGLVRFEITSALTLAAPSEMVSALVDLVQTPEFASDFGRTMYTIGVAFAFGAVGGLLLGVLLWRFTTLGAILEPYLASLYAMPTLVFYPILLAILGLGAGPIIVIAASMALIPIALNTMVALRSVSPVLPKLGRSLNCTKPQLYWKIIVPAATPLAVPGLKLGFIYTVIGTVAMEFILASHGLGFRTGYNYRDFNTVDMYAHILLVALISIVANSCLNALERRVRRDMA